MPAGPGFRMNLRDSLADELPRGVTQVPGRVSARDQDSQRGFGDDGHDSTPLISLVNAVAR
jgi:hypothetical protein